jgi:hypothetical protein
MVWLKRALCLWMARKWGGKGELLVLVLAKAKATRNAKNGRREHVTFIPFLLILFYSVYFMCLSVNHTRPVNGRLWQQTERWTRDNEPPGDAQAAQAARFDGTWRYQPTPPRNVAPKVEKRTPDIVISAVAQLSPSLTTAIQNPVDTLFARFPCCSPHDDSVPSLSIHALAHLVPQAPHLSPAATLPLVPAFRPPALLEQCHCSETRSSFSNWSI